MNENGDKYKGVKVEYHILQSFPVTCLNRDDVGAPKTAEIGGVTRARVSSQAWKRQVRMSMKDFGVQLGVRTKHVEEKLARYCIDLGASEEQAAQCGQAVAKELTKDTLHFFTETEARALGEYAKKLGFDGSKVKAKEVIKIHRKAYDPNVDGLDIALFGRMVAQAPDLNIEAASSFAHAISTHKVANELDFFTAIDDFIVNPEERVTGSAHMGSIEYNSATYYRYVSLDVGQLVQTLGDDSTLKQAISAFTKALYIAIPTARQTTQSGANLWDYAKVLIRRGQRIQASFDKPVRAKVEGYLEPSREMLESFIEKKERLSGSLFGKIEELTWGVDDSYSIDNLIDSIQTAVSRAYE